MKKLSVFITILLCISLSFAFAGGQQDDAGDKMMASGSLVINSNASDPAPKEAFAEVVKRFEAEYPDIDVELNTFDHEAYKENIRNFLVSGAPDVALWFAGNRMKFFVDQGLFEDVSDVWENNNLNNEMASTLKSLTIDGKQYGVPYGYYQWGVYYRKDIFDRYGLSEPKTWEEFLNVCSVLKQNGITPITIGTKFLWTAAGWFDYLNLRINGYAYHIGLTDGDVSYLDSKLDAVFDAWAELIDNGYFLVNPPTFSWQEAQAPLINGKAGMYLIGNFLISFMVDAGIVDNIDFFQFPIINPAAGIAEDAPTETAHIPSGAKNKENAKLFLAFLARADINNYVATAIDNLAPNNKAPAPSDRFLVEGAKMLAEADALAQFYDRDTNPEMAKAGMEGFQEFMVNPSREQAIRERLEQERKQVFGN